ncbi:MAG: pectinesterase family protein [Lachnospiraceae bacterium]|nr:pectinesterase family protein [Lachnospiraceae bacterium]
MQIIHVSKTRPGSFPSLQSAVLSIEDGPREKVVICIEPGIYEEKVFIRKENIEIVGENPANTVICYGDGAYQMRPDGSRPYGTFNTAVMLFAGRDITVENITIKNTAGPGEQAGQALAIYAGADRLTFRNCRLIGYQDTVFAGYVKDFDQNPYPMLPDFFTESQVPISSSPVRNYFKDCYICGDIDFIFGPNTAFFENCEIHTERESFISAASTWEGQEYGLVFSHCALTGRDTQEERIQGREGTQGGEETQGREEDQGGEETRSRETQEQEACNTYLGRPWRDYARTAFVCCTMGSHIYPEGWDNWNKPKAEKCCTYVEYGNTGPGSADFHKEARVPFSRQLTDPGTAEHFSKEKVLGGEDGWNP